MSSSRAAKADKALQDKLQALLSHLLREEDNKYCADCDAKGPRWASWNLGIFVCIRCAGIHRNLGVHISRVKSVNLDSWTEEQVGSVQNMGNSKGRAVYEANLPDSFRRPQTDSALETFIRGKYEHKKYIAREWIPPTGPQKADFSVLGGGSAAGATGGARASAASGADKRQQRNLSSTAAGDGQKGVPRPNSTGNLKDYAATTPTTPKTSTATSTPAAAPTSPSDDLFADFISAPLPSATTPATTTAAQNTSQKSLSPESEEKDFFNQVSAGPPSAAGTPGANGGLGGKFDTASIMSLYGKAPPVQSPLMQQQQQQLVGGMSLSGPLNGVTPHMAANNPFLVGGMVAPQAPPPTGFGIPAGGALGAFPGVTPAAAQPAFNQLNMAQPFMMAGAPTNSMNLMNSQLAGLQLGGGGAGFGAAPAAAFGQPSQSPQLRMLNSQAAAGGGLQPQQQPFKPANGSAASTLSTNFWN